MALVLVTFLLAGCDSSRTTDDVGMRTVIFPNGTRIKAESAVRQIELLRGMMFRESLAPDHGMLFTHPAEDIYQYWMFQTKIPLDIIWLDHDRRIVEISANTPPCTSKSAKDCPNYGGNFKSRYVLEVKAGVAQQNGLKAGDQLTF